MLDLPTPVQEMSEEVSEYTDISENMLSLFFSACLFSSPLPICVLPCFYVERMLNVVFEHVAVIAFSVMLCLISLCANCGR